VNLLPSFTSYSPNAAMIVARGAEPPIAEIAWNDGTPMARILIIDDDHAVRLTIQVILEHEGHEVICAADGSQGLSMFDRSSPQLIITDIIMPNKEGLETIMQLRGRDPVTPIIAVSGGGRIGSTDFLKMALKVGADEVLSKPFERHDLTAAVRRMLPN
jgi:DNA-binding response OmpR family regulator